MGALIPDRATREHSGAVISDDGKYRYLLWRDWEITRPLVTWIMYNPSTAGAVVNDPTIRRCIGLSAAQGFGGIEVVNLYAYRVTNPKEIDRIKAYGGDVFGPLNDEYIQAACPPLRSVIAAWGANGSWPYGKGFQMFCFGQASNGQPRHPLYLKADSKLEPFRIE